MDCKIYQTDLIGFIKGNLTGEEMSRLQEHLGKCPECRSFAGYLEETLGVIRIEKEIEPDPFLATRIEGILQRRQLQPVRRSFSLNLIPALGFSLFILAGVFGGFGIGKLITPGHSSEAIVTSELRMVMDDLMQEPIETFLLEL
jgi:predicted anti-sigma-YlaC factor YlaD